MAVPMKRCAFALSLFALSCSLSGPGDLVPAHVRLRAVYQVLVH